MICLILEHHGGGNLYGKVYHDLRTTEYGKFVRLVLWKAEMKEDKNSYLLALQEISGIV